MSLHPEVEKAIRILRSGTVVAMPTETVYGLAADCTNDFAVAKIYALKDRPKFNPLIIHIYSMAQAEEIALFTPAAREYAKKYWPGPLTIVLPKRDKKFALLASAGLDTIALRMPAHRVAREILQSGLLLAAPSANKSGSLSPTRAEHVQKNFPNSAVIPRSSRDPLSHELGIDPVIQRGDDILYIIDGGACEVGLESTIITFDENDAPVVLREGSVQVEGKRPKVSDKIIAPGMLLRHYAPENPIRINAADALPDEVFIGFGNGGEFDLSATQNLAEAAANLFAMLHAADTQNKKIAVAAIPNIGIGVAINDKLTRAANGTQKKHKI